MSYELKNFKVLGYTTDFNKCECCGKEGLKGTISILDLNSDGVVLHYGTTCAYHADKYDSMDAAKEAKKAVQSAERDYKNTISFARSVARKVLMDMYGHTGNTTTPSHQLLAPKAEIKRIMDDCENWYTNPENKFKAYPRFKKA